MPLVRRVPKRGFNNKWARHIAIINVGDLDAQFDAGADVTPAALEKTPLLGHRYDELKILGNGELTKKLIVSAHRFSKSAIEKIEQVGGQVVRLPGPTPVAEKRQQSAGKSAGKSAEQSPDT
jgi:large subunit ribosomal protein L15